MRAKDAEGLSAEQSFVVIADEDTSPPPVTLSVSPTTVAPGVPVLISATATDNVSAELVVTVNGVSVSLSSVGTAVFTSSVPGAYRVEAVATDPAGNETRRTVSFGIQVAGDSTPPALALTSSAEDRVVTFLADVAGSIVESSLLSWALTMVNNGDGQATMVASRDSAPPSGAFGQIDATLLTNGLYTLRLEATDVNGLTSILERPIEVDGAAKVGIFTVSFNDLTIPVSGIPISVTRTYDSRVKVKKDFGVGWELSVAAGRFTTNRKLGDGWTMEKKVGFGQPPCGLVKEPKKHRVEVRLSDREVFRFVPAILNPSGGLGFCEGELTFEDAGGVRPGAKLELVGQRFVYQQTGETLLRDPDTLVVFDPQDVRLTTPEGVVFDVNRKKGITRIQDRNANVLRVTASGITSNTGLGVAFHRDAEGRIDSITDPLGRVLSYRYDASGDLVSFKDPLLNETTFRYLASPAHHLEEIINARGERGIRNEYDSGGRLVATIDARGRRIEMEHDLSGQRELVRDRLGNPTEFFYDVRGNVTLERRFVTVDSALVPVDTTRTYDANDNELTVTDPLGHVTVRTYDAGSNVTSVTVADGTPDAITTTYTYNMRNQLLTTTDALGAVTRTTYDPKGNAIFETDAMGRTSTSTYDLAGNVLTTADPLGNTTRFSYDLRGRMLTRTDAEGVTTSYTHDALGNQLSEVIYRTDEFGAQVKVERTQKYDALNRVVSDVDALGHEAVTEYDELGRVKARVDRRGFRNVTEYDELGQLSAMRYADGTHDSYTYDAEGRRLETTDRGGRVTSAEYDELGRRVRSVNADLTTRSTVYDLGGNVRAEIDERGNRTEYEYDAQNRRVLTRSAVGDVTRVGFDAVGNRETATDGRGNVTTFEYDANRRQIATLFADGYRTRTVYDFDGRVVRRLDQRNVPTRYEYDGVGRLVAVVDALGGRTSYGYDELGNRVRQTDANVHTTRFGFDSEGRMVSRTLPLGQRESLEYDAEGNQTAKVTFKGDRLEYDFDSNARMVRKRVPGYSEYVLTYTPTSQRESVVDHRGLTSYEYDVRDRLLRVENPEGTFVSYTYDLAGNRASITSPSQTVGYTFDALNRMETVTSPAGVATYSYDAASNQVGLTNANGVHEVRTYDALNRLLTIENRTSGGQLVTSHAYALGPTGTRVAVQEHNGRFVTWSYDDLYRLVGEDIADPVNGDESIAFSYDPVGNRMSRTDRSGLTDYAYDDNDRLLDVKEVARTYDDNGNTLTVGATTYAWTPENRLVGADTGSQVLAFEYNFDGIRVSKNVDGVETEYVLDANRPYAEVIEERAISGLQASYVHGHDLMSQERGAARSFYHTDGIGSTRALTDFQQSVSASYAYEAFGVVSSSSGSTANSYGFAGEQVDAETGLEYLRARYYDQETGRFLSQDPFVGLARVPASLGRYVYASNSPALSSDPSGAIEPFTLAVLTVVAITGILVALPGCDRVQNFETPMPAVYYDDSQPWLHWGLPPKTATQKAVIASGAQESFQADLATYVGLGLQLRSGARTLETEPVVRHGFEVQGQNGWVHFSVGASECSEHRAAAGVNDGGWTNPRRRDSCVLADRISALANIQSKGDAELGSYLGHVAAHEWGHQTLGGFAGVVDSSAEPGSVMADKTEDSRKLRWKPESIPWDSGQQGKINKLMPRGP